MFDSSSLPYEKNVEKTKEAVRIAHSQGVTVEGELGSVGGSAVESGNSEASGHNVFTDPDQAKEFVERTGVDALAISFGNVHGEYRGEPRLDLHRVKRIASLVDVPLVMHGASGLSPHDYPRIIESGISKINYYSAMAAAAVENIRRKLASPAAVCPQEPAIFKAHHLISWNIEFYTDATIKLLDLLGSSGKA
jgi:fructose-bisphosphate aldolase class II